MLFLQENIITDNNNTVNKKRVVLNCFFIFCSIFAGTKLKENVMRSMIKHIIILLAFITIDVNVVNAGNVLGFGAGSFAVVQPRAVRKAQKAQEKKERDEKKAIARSSKETQKRAYEIQSPEVKKRMKENKKEIKAREKARRRQNNSQTRIGINKYR